MSDDLVKTLLESLSEEQKEKLIKEVLNIKVKKKEVPPTNEDETPQESPTQVNQDFTVTRDNGLNRGKTPVKARRNKWVDEGEDRDPDFDPEKFERMGKSARSRGQTKKRHVECHICGRGFHLNESLIYGEYIRCNRCTGR